MQQKFRADIEGLRAIAVLSVVIFHFGVAALPGGFVGVDVFFVISGYLISGLLLDELGRTGSIDLWRFYGRRARRLLPASLLMTLVTLIFALVLLGPGEQMFAAKGALASSLYASNFWFMTLLGDYFAPESATNPFLHTWSLAVEEQFYLVWPALLLFLWRKRPSVRTVAIVMTVLTALSFLLCLWLSYRKQSWAFYASPARAWEFGIGALAVLKPVTEWARRSAIVTWLGWSGVAVLFATFLFLNEEVRFPGWAAVVPVVATVAILISGASDRRTGPALVLETSLLQWFGKHSYSLYLWHWPVIVYVSIVEMTDPVTKVVVCGGLSLALAAAGFRLFEHPIRASAWLAAKPLRSVTLGATLTLAGVVIALSTAQAARQFSLDPMQADLLRWAQEQPTASGSGRNCLIDFRVIEPVTCEFGAASPSKTVVLFGDSHADQWSTPLAQLANEQGWKLVTLLKASCAVADIPSYSIRLRRDWPECMQWRQQAIEHIRQLRPDLVVISQFSNGYIQGRWSAHGNRGVTYQQWAEGLQRSLGQLRSADIPVLLLRDSPSPGRNVGKCLARSRWRGTSEESCDTLVTNALDPRLSQLESQVAAAAGVQFADLSAQFCQGDKCPVLHSGVLVYRDANHMTTVFAARQARALSTVLSSGEWSHRLPKKRATAASPATMASGKTMGQDFLVK